MASVDSKDTWLAMLVSLVVNVYVRFHLNSGEITSTPFLNLCRKNQIKRIVGTSAHPSTLPGKISVQHRQTLKVPYNTHYQVFIFYDSTCLEGDKDKTAAE